MNRRGWGGLFWWVGLVVCSLAVWWVAWCGMDAIGDWPALAIIVRLSLAAAWRV